MREDEKQGGKRVNQKRNWGIWMSKGLERKAKEVYSVRVYHVCPFQTKPLPKSPRALILSDLKSCEHLSCRSHDAGFPATPWSGLYTMAARGGGGATPPQMNASTVCFRQ